MASVFTDSDSEPEPDPEPEPKVKEPEPEPDPETKEPEFIGFPYTIKFVSDENYDYDDKDIISENNVCITIETDIYHLVEKGLGECLLGDILKLRLKECNAKKDHEPIKIVNDSYTQICKGIDLEDFKKVLKEAIETDYNLLECEKQLRAALGIFMSYSGLKIDIPEKEIRDEINDKFPILIQKSYLSVRQYKKIIKEIINENKLNKNSINRLFSKGRDSVVKKKGEDDSYVTTKKMLSYYLSILKDKKLSVINDHLKYLEKLLKTLLQDEDYEEYVSINISMLKILPYLVIGSYSILLKIFETFKIISFNKSFMMPQSIKRDKKINIKDSTAIFDTLSKMMIDQTLIAGIIGAKDNIWKIIDKDKDNKTFTDVVVEYFKDVRKPVNPTLKKIRGIPLNILKDVVTTSKNQARRLIPICFLTNSEASIETAKKVIKFNSYLIRFLPAKIRRNYDIIKIFVESEGGFPPYIDYDDFKIMKLIPRWKSFLLLYFSELEYDIRIIAELNRLIVGFDLSELDFFRRFNFYDFELDEVREIDENFQEKFNYLGIYHDTVKQEANTKYLKKIGNDVENNNNAIKNQNTGFLETFLDIIVFLIEKKGLSYNDLEGELEHFKDVKDVVLALVAQNGNNLEYVSDEFKKDEKVVLAAVAQSRHALMYASDDMKNTKKVVLAAIKHSASTLMHASDELKKDKDVALAAVSKDGHALMHVSDELDDYKEVVLAAVEQNGLALMHVSEELQNDIEVVMTAMFQNVNALKYSKIDIEKEKFSTSKKKTLEKTDNGNRAYAVLEKYIPDHDDNIEEVKKYLYGWYKFKERTVYDFFCELKGKQAVNRALGKQAVNKALGTGIINYGIFGTDSEYDDTDKYGLFPEICNLSKRKTKSETKSEPDPAPDPEPDPETDHETKETKETNSNFAPVEYVEYYRTKSRLRFF